MHWCAISFKSVYPACTYIHAYIVKQNGWGESRWKRKYMKMLSRSHISFMHDIYFREQRDMLYR